MAHKKKGTVAAHTRLPADYPAFLESLKERVRRAQTKAVLSVNRELIELYWDIGRLIVGQQDREGWGKSVVDRLACDLQKAFPGIGGFSGSNVSRMRAFYLAYATAPEVSAQAVPKLAVKQPSRRKSAQTVPKRGKSASRSPYGLVPRTAPRLR